MSKIKLIPSKVNLITLDDFITKVNNITDDNITHKNLTSLGFVCNKDIKGYYYINIDKVFIKAVVIEIEPHPTVLLATYVRYNKNGDIYKATQAKVNSISTLSGNVQKSLNLLKNG